MGSVNVKKFELKLGRTGIIITIAGMAVFICFSFILGVTVGKNIDTYPEKISLFPQRVLAFFWRPAKVAVKQSQESGKWNESDKSNVDLTFHQNLMQSKTPSIQPHPAMDKKREQISVESNAPATVPVTSELASQKMPSENENSPIQKKTASEKKIPESRAHKKETASSSGETGVRFLIHVASLKEKNKADQIHNSISELGYKAKTVKVNIKDKGVWYRVIVPGFETKAQAKAAVDKISRKVKTNCIIRQADTDAEKNR